MNTTMNFQTDEEALAIAREVAGDRASLSLHDGNPGHRAIKIHGCDFHDAERVGADIEARLFSGPDRHKVGLVAKAGFVAVWIR